MRPLLQFKGPKTVNVRPTSRLPPAMVKEARLGLSVNLTVPPTISVLVGVYVPDTVRRSLTLAGFPCVLTVPHR